MSQRSRDASRAETRPFVTWRAVILGVCLLPPNAYWLTWNLWFQGQLSMAESLFKSAVFVLAVLVGLNGLIRRYLRRPGLAPGELLVVYAMVTIGTTFCAGDFQWFTYLPTFIAYPYRFATLENRWAEKMLPFLPYWLYVTDESALEGFWSGRVSPYSLDILKAWWGPALWWTSFVTALVWVFLCMSSLMRKRWVEEEKMMFPVVVLPMAMVSRESQLWRQRTFQIGAGTAAAATLLNFFASFVPALPSIPFSYDFGPHIANLRPWSGILVPSLSYEPFLVGLCFLIPLDLLFSLWVFMLLGKVQQVMMVQLGWETRGQDLIYFENQAFGALVALVLMAIWLDRGYLRALLRNVLFRRGPLADEREALGHRMALVGLVAGVGYLWWFLRNMGMTVVAGTALLGIYLLISSTLTRFRAQLGPPYHEMNFDGPRKVMRMLVGASNIDAGTEVAYTLMDPIDYNQCNSPSPLTIEALKMGEGQRTLRGLAAALMLAAVVGSLSYFWATVQVVYPGGASIRGHMSPALAGTWEHSNLDYHLTESVKGGGNWLLMLPLAIGAALCTVLMVLKLLYPAFPLHPLAFPVASGWNAEAALGGVFIAWALKASVLRWGGQGSYRLAHRIALGVLVGSAVTASVLSILRQLPGIQDLIP